MPSHLRVRVLLRPSRLLSNNIDGQVFPYYYPVKMVPERAVSLINSFVLSAVVGNLPMLSSLIALCPSTSEHIDKTQRTDANSCTSKDRWQLLRFKDITAVAAKKTCLLRDARELQDSRNRTEIRNGSWKEDQDLFRKSYRVDKNVWLHSLAPNVMPVTPPTCRMNDGRAACEARIRDRMMHFVSQPDNPSIVKDLDRRFRYRGQLSYLPCR